MTVYSEEKNLNKHSKFQYPVVGSFLAILIVATDTDMFLVKAFFLELWYSLQFLHLQRFVSCLSAGLLPGTRNPKELTNVYEFITEELISSL